MTSYWTKRRKLRAEIDNYMKLINEENESSSNSDGEVESNVVSVSSLPPAGSPDITEATIQIRNPETLLNLNSTLHVDNDNDYDVTLPVADSDSSISSDYDFNESGQLQTDLAKWAVDHKLPHNALGGLLAILGKWFADLPKDPRTLLHTETSVLSRTVSSWWFVLSRWY